MLSLTGTYNICSGTSTSIGVTITGGISPYTVVYSDGTNNYTVSNYQSGDNITVSPLVSTTYTLVSVTDANSMTGTGNSGTAVIQVGATPAIPTISGTLSFCTGGKTYFLLHLPQVEISGIWTVLKFR